LFYEQLHWLFQIVCVISCASRLPLAADDEPLSNTDEVVLKIQEAADKGCALRETAKDWVALCSNVW
jgi:hypothetical protein